MKAHAALEGGCFVIDNGRMRLCADWNNGHVRLKSLEDKAGRVKWDFEALLPDMFFPELPESAGEGRLECVEAPEDGVRPAHLQAINSFRLGSLEVKRVFRVYPGCPLVGCDLYLKGKAPGSWAPREIMRHSRPIEDIRAALEKKMSVPVLARLHFKGALHLKLSCVEFSDRTDYHNTLVFRKESMPYPMPAALTGNLLLIRDEQQGRGLVLLKESALSAMQIACPGHDFLVSLNHVMLAGPGLSPSDVREDEWTRGYGFALGALPCEEEDLLEGLRDYEERLRVYRPERDSMVLMNTWGDRGQDRSIGEAFAFKEISAAKRLSIGRFQLDDGWQAGHTPNSALPGGSFSDIWSSGDYWKPHPARFPNGLSPVVEAGKKAGVEICLWFNPAHQNSYENWEKDADCLIELYKKYGIRTFKIDGVEIPDRLAEKRLRALFDRVQKAAAGNAVFNLDVTAGRRFGYFWFYEYGNRFLENRYTDWRNYYPHWTLRNLWTLSRYVPPQTLQIEFLNKWRNAEKYGKEDPLAPIHVPFDYCFAVTMAAQPLAWFEGSRLPEEAFSIGPLIGQYRKIQPELHACRIFPIGGEPDGFSWTGFQAIDGKKGGFVLVFREKTKEGKGSLKLWRASKKAYHFKKILGSGKDFSAKPDNEGRVTFTLPKPFSFCLYREDP